VLKLRDLYGKDRIVPAFRPGKLGLGTAYVHGLQFAKGNFVIIMDADMSHHPKAIPQMVAKQQEVRQSAAVAITPSLLRRCTRCILRRKTSLE
jgi:glycosyltransferase involved in cell wall biosynthesis